MVRRCCVGGCKSNYDSQDEVVHVHSFPSDPVKRKEWIDALPNILPKEPTRDMVVCVKHWPPNYKTISKKGHQVPAEAPSVFSVPKSCTRQTVPTKSRNVETRNIDSDSRQNSAKNLELQKDCIVSWEKLEIFCNTLPDVTVIRNVESLILAEVVGIPPKMAFSLQIFRDYTISCYKGYTKVTYNDLINSFSHKIEKYSQVIDILNRLKKAEYDIAEELKGVAANIQDILDSDENLDESEKEKVKFLIDQMSHGRKYDETRMKNAISLYLRSRNCYNLLREYLHLPHPNTIRNYFGTLDTPGAITDCENTIKSVLSKVKGKQRYCRLLFDEIHIKPSVRYQGNHIIGFSVDKPSKPARTVLAIMVAPMMGVPAFVCRLIPVYSLKHILLYEQTLKVIQLIHTHNGLVFLLMCDNLRANQACFRLYSENFGEGELFSCKHPVSNEVFIELYLLYDPTHLLKNIRNNWHTEKMQKLKFTDPATNQTVTAKWSDLVNIYNSEKDSIVKNTKLTHATLYPTNFEKQKVSLAMNIFNEKTVAALELKGFKDTAIFVRAVTNLWNCLNVKKKYTGKNLNDKNRYPFESVDDVRFQNILNIAEKFKEMNTSLTSYSARVMCLTTDTSQALFRTITGLVSLIKLLLLDGFSYVLAGNFQSDRLEGEFGIYRQSSGGCYYISMQQVMNSLSLQRLKLYHKLNITQTDLTHTNKECCTNTLKEVELFMLDESFVLRSTLSETEESALYYISGYVARKENITTSSSLDMENYAGIEYPSSEFTTLLSRGKLVHPPPELFELCCVLYCYYQNVDKSCIKHLLHAFSEIYESSQVDYAEGDNILRRFVNTFSNAFSKHESDKIKEDKKKKNMKRKRLSNE